MYLQLNEKSMYVGFHYLTQSPFKLRVHKYKFQTKNFSNKERNGIPYETQYIIYIIIQFDDIFF